MRCGDLQEAALLTQLSMDCERLLARAFESYHSLSESSPTGILEGGQAGTEVPPPALKPAVQLCSTHTLPSFWIQEPFDMSVQCLNESHESQTANWTASRSVIWREGGADMWIRVVMMIDVG